jgi:hypothetical protein
MNEPAAKTAYEELSDISHRLYRAQSIVETAAAATQASPPLENLTLQYTLDFAGKLLLELAGDIEFIGRRMQWTPPKAAPKAEEAQT